MVKTLRIFDSVDHDFDKLEVSSGSELKNKPDGWESTTKEQDGNLWEMSQREEDILLQEFDRRTAFCKFQVLHNISDHRSATYSNLTLLLLRCKGLAIFDYKRSRLFRSHCCSSNMIGCADSEFYKATYIQ